MLMATFKINPNNVYLAFARRISTFGRKSMKVGESIIGRRPIKLVPGVSVGIKRDIYRGEHLVVVKGPLGEISQIIKNQVDVRLPPKDSTILLKQDKDSPVYDKALLGTYRTVIQNMIYDTAIGYFKKLELHGIGFRAFFDKDKDGRLNKSELRMRLGTTHDVVYKVPEDILIQIFKEGTRIRIYGCDRRRVCEEAKKIRRLKKPEVYKGKGIRYEGEQIKLKKVQKVDSK
ncbi:hypothetical protein MHBO_000733 [Bonamia ostreae]|uniref:Large ribosomal subunit protein uL6 alpha-beta domain-containing protein n=1 Tax=Bonamia ostreae TaxID=126728 RepID=A0ABV2AHG2_9EUKA